MPMITTTAGEDAVKGLLQNPDANKRLLMFMNSFEKKRKPGSPRPRVVKTGGRHVMKK